MLGLSIIYYVMRSAYGLFMPLVVGVTSAVLTAIVLPRSGPGATRFEYVGPTSVHLLSGALPVRNVDQPGWEMECWRHG